MNGDLLLDTNIIVLIMNGQEQTVARALTAARTMIPVIALGELYFGALRSGRIEQNLQRVAEIESQFQIVPCDTRTSRLYGGIRERLRVSGRPIPENDIWIAALAIQHDLLLISRDAHFNEVVGLRHEAW